MQMTQGQFPRLKDNIQLKEFGKQKVVWHLMVSLCNCQALKVGINQILNVFMSRKEGFHSCAALEDANNCFNQTIRIDFELNQF